MYQEINSRLEELLQKKNRYNKITSMVNALKKQQEEQEKTAYYLKIELDKEQSDVDKLEGKNLTSLFMKVLGSKEKQLDKERQEFLSVKLKYDEAVYQIEDTKNQIRSLLSERSDLSSSEREYEELLAEKQRMVFEDNSEISGAKSRLEQEILNCKAVIKELDEAICEGKKVVTIIDKTMGSLDSAEGWGVWDTFAGGGLVSSLVKHSHIDDAKRFVRDMQRQISKFKIELTDVNMTAKVEIDIDGFVKFSDFFFDGLIADWVVQSRIEKSISSVREVKRQINLALGKLMDMRNEQTGKVTDLEYQIKALWRDL